MDEITAWSTWPAILSTSSGGVLRQVHAMPGRLQQMGEILNRICEGKAETKISNS